MNFKGKNFYEVKDKLQNEGMRTKKTIFKKSICVGKTDDKEESRVFLDCEITEIDLSTEVLFSGKDTHNILQIGNTHETIDHKTITKYTTLSISGRSKDFGGQIVDELKNINTTHRKKLNRIVEIWKEYHLNDCRAGCIHQDKIEYTTEGAKEQTKKCPLKYKYGSKWLVEVLPKSIIEEIKELFSGW